MITSYPHQAPAELLQAEKNIIKLGSNVCIYVYIYIYIYIYYIYIYIYIYIHTHYYNE